MRRPIPDFSSGSVATISPIPPAAILSEPRGSTISAQALVSPTDLLSLPGKAVLRRLLSQRLWRRAAIPGQAHRLSKYAASCRLAVRALSPASSVHRAHDG